MYGSLNSYDGDPNVLGCDVSPPSAHHATQGDDNGALTLRDMVALGKKTMKRPARADELVCCSTFPPGEQKSAGKRSYGKGAERMCAPCYQR